jgi:DNA primase
MVTNILMDEEKYTLSDWERREIFVKGRDSDLPKLVIDTVFNLRRVLIDEKIASLVSGISEKENNDLLLEEVVNYSDLKNKLFKHLNRVV